MDVTHGGPREGSEARRGASQYDLLLTGGRVIDPASGRDGRFDIAFSGGKVAAIEPSIAPAGAERVVDIRDAVVVPGLIDAHTHVCKGIGDCISPDVAGVGRGITTVADGGTLGVSNFGVFGPLMANTRTRVLAWLNISAIGQTDNQLGECLALPLMRVDDAVEVAKANPDVVVGFKARLSTYASGGADLTVLELLLQAGEAAGLPVMIHVGDTQHTLGEILDRMRPGDWVSHFLTPRRFGILGINYIPGAKLIPQASAAASRGVIMDVARGRNHVGFPQLQAWLDAGFRPTCISSDVTTPGSADPEVSVLRLASALMSFGLRLEDVVPMMTLNPAVGIGKERLGLGRLEPGGLGDATLLKVAGGEYTFRDVNGLARTGDKLVQSTGVVLGGVYTALPPVS